MLASFAVCSYGVAGSLVVPTTTIGGAPTALPVGYGACVRRGRRGLARLVQDRGEGGLRIGSDRAAGALGLAVGGEVVVRVREALRLALGGADRASRRVDRPVEHHGADALGKELGVRG